MLKFRRVENDGFLNVKEIKKARGSLITVGRDVLLVLFSNEEVHNLEQSRERGSCR